jgi:putative transposase
MKKIISEKIMKEIEPLLPRKTSKRGRPTICPKRAFLGIMYVLKTGIQWRFLPEEFGCSNTVHGTFMRWIRLGFFQKLYDHSRTLYQKTIPNHNWIAIDTSSKKAPFAKKWSGNNPTDRAKKGIKQVIIVDRNGAPLTVDVAAANQYDSTLLEPIVRQLSLPKNLMILAADSAFDDKKLRYFCKEKNIALIASRNPRNSKDKHTFSVPHRWVVERTFGWLAWQRSLKICWTKLRQTYLSFLQLAAAHQLFKMSSFFG